MEVWFLKFSCSKILEINIIINAVFTASPLERDLHVFAVMDVTSKQNEYLSLTVKFLKPKSPKTGKRYFL